MDSPTPTPLPRRVAGMRPWQLRLRGAGLTQRLLGELLDRPEQTIQRQMLKDPPDGYIRAAILAWAIMSPEQRQAWLRALKP